MKKLLAAFTAIALIAVLPAQATTFSLRTIYVASGVYDSGDAADVGTATSVHCTNLSGNTAQLRVSFYGNTGGFEGASNSSIANLTSGTTSTHATIFTEDPLNTGPITQGVLNIQ